MSGGRRSSFYLIVGIGGLLFAVVALSMILNYAQIGAAKNRANEAAASGKLAVLVAVDPIAGLVERIGGDRIAVATLTPAGKDPESFAPTPADLGKLATTRLFFCVGLPVEARFAQNVAAIAPKAKIVDLRAGLDLLASEHSHSDAENVGNGADLNALNVENATVSGDAINGEEGEPLDPHLWTSPALARQIVAKVAAALSEESPNDAEFFAQNAAAFDAELAALQAEIVASLQPFSGRTFVVFHPAYGYFAREFHLSQRAIESGGKAPRARELADLIEFARREGIRAAIVQPEFNRSAAESVARQLGVGLIVHSPLEKDYFANLRALNAAVVAALTPSEYGR